MTPVQAVDSAQISMLKKNDPIQLGAKVMQLLVELTQFASCSWDGRTVAPIAKMLIDQFWMLRIEELTYIFRTGVSGGFGQVSWAQLQYVHICQWITVYISEHREGAEDVLRNKAKQEFAANKIVNVLPEGAALKMANMFAVDKKGGEITKETPTLEYFDDKAWGYFLSTKNGYSIDELQKMTEDAKRSGFTKTQAAIEVEIHSRAKG